MVILVTKKQKEKSSDLIKRIDFTTPEALERQKKLDEEIEEANRLAREKAEREAEEERKQQEKEALDYHKIMREINRKKFEANPPPYKPSRLIDVDTDVTVMNMSEDLLSVKETVEQLERMLWEISEFLFKKDKKKRERLELKKLKRKASLKGRSQGGTKKQ